jgi:DNA-binding response OmpR family regulator
LLAHPLEVASIPGRGTRFSVVGPRLSRRRIRGDGQVPPAPATAALPNVAPFTGRRILVIDDDPAVVAAMSALFTAWGADVAGGANVAAVAAAWAAAAGVDSDARRPPDLIVADLRLADAASGVDAVAELHLAIGATPPALIVSGDTSEAARTEVDAAGFTLLSKPVVAAALAAAAAALLRPTTDEERSSPIAPRPMQPVAG